MKPESIALIYDRICKVLGEKLPKEYLNTPGLSERKIRSAEKELGCRMPEDVRDFYKISNGLPRLEIIPDHNIGFILPLAKPQKKQPRAMSTVHDVWKLMNEVIPTVYRELDDSWLNPKGPIERVWWTPTWIPLFGNLQADHLLIDMNPPKRGIVGQLIEYWKLDGPKRVYAKSFRAFLERFASDLERDLYVIESGNYSAVVIKKSVRRKERAYEREQLRKRQERDAARSAKDTK